MTNGEFYNQERIYWLPISVGNFTYKDKLCNVVIEIYYRCKHAKKDIKLRSLPVYCSEKEPYADALRALDIWKKEERVC